MRNVVHVTTSLGIGGAEAVLCDVVTGLAAHQFQQQVIYFYDGPYRARLEAKGIVVHGIRGLICRYDPWFWVRLFFLLRKQRPDVIHALLWSANISCRIMGRLLRIPVVSAQHNAVSLESGMRAFFDRLTRPLSTELIAVSLRVLASLNTQQRWLPCRPVRLIANGVAVEEIQHAAQLSQLTRADVGFEEHHFVIGAVGRFHPVKKFPLLIDSFALVHRQHMHARLLLVGMGPEESALRMQVKRLGLDHAVQFVVGQAAYGFYSLFDCFVMPSAQEGLSRALLEAMSCQRVCIVASDTKKHELIIHRKTGFLVPADDEKVLAATLCSVLIERDAMSVLQKAACTQVSTLFSCTSMVTAYAQVLRDVSL